MIRIVADDKIPFLKGALEGVARWYIPSGCERFPATDLQDADALITRTRTKCDRDLLEGTRVRFIASATIGYDHIDTEYCREAWDSVDQCTRMQFFLGQAIHCIHPALPGQSSKPGSEGTDPGDHGGWKCGKQGGKSCRGTGNEGAAE